MIKQRKVIFTDPEIVEFCNVTRDTNVIHQPAFMDRLGKRVIVPGMFALSSTACLSEEFLKNRANSIRVLFNSLLSSGDFATLNVSEIPDIPDEIRLSAVNHKDTLTTKDDYTRIYYTTNLFSTDYDGILHRLDLDPVQIDVFKRLIKTEDSDTANFLFAVSYASQALLKAILNPQTDIEKEVEELIQGGSGVSPFYHTLEIQLPSPFPKFNAGSSIDYYVHFERGKKNKLYKAHVRCIANGTLIFHSRYQMIGINNQIILRMAKDILHHKK
jgi:hypothetical protein